MEEKLALNEEQIVNEYTNSNIGVEKLALKYHVGKNRIKSILSEFNINIKKRGGQKNSDVYLIDDTKNKKYANGHDYHYIVRDAKTDWQSNDIDNRGGVLTSYLKKQYDITIPSLYERNKYYKTTGNYWWEQYLKYEKVRNSKTKKCPFCHWETTDVSNKSGMFETHLLKKHDLTKQEYIKQFPQDKDYFITKNPIINRQLETDDKKFVVCKICGKKLARIDSHHLVSHNITKLEYIEKFGNKNLSSSEYHSKQSTASINNNINYSFVKNSKAEIEIKNFIEANGLKCKTDRSILKGKEVDIFIPDKNIGIEYNGNKWHTEWFGKKNKHYHLDKLQECKEKGIGLITIFEDEYELHKEIVLNKIAHILKLANNNYSKIYARNCMVKEIYRFNAKEFLDKNHIQGFVNSSIYLGAFYKEKLVGVMSFTCQPNNNWELTRFATDNNFVCCGIGGKLFTFFIRHYKFNEIKSFADRRWTINEKDNVYTKLGFKFEGFTNPNYTYYNSSVDRYKRFHKFNFRKEKLLKRYSELTPSMTETEMVKKLGYDRIWDCGLIKYVWKKDEH